MLSHLIMIPAALAICLLAPPTLAAPTIWTGPSISFAKAGFADWTLPENQDRITDTVWITRGNNQSLFNAQQESSYSSPSPSGTAWAMGTTDELSSLTFGTWVSVFGGGALPGGPTAAVGQDFVLHLTAEDIYIDLRVDAWGSGSAAGGGFAYTRSTAAVPEPAAIGLSLAAAGAASCRRRRR